MPYSGRSGGTYKEVRVLKAPLLACLTCPLCSYLIREATTISECLHTFCRDCITLELSNGDSECCPMCQVGLGTLPLEKLRADHQLNDLKEKLFPTDPKKRKPGVSLDGPETSNATKRKERSLYSLGVKGSQAVNPGYASRKTRALPGTHGSSEPSRMDEDLEDGGDSEDEGISDDSPSTMLRLDSRAVSHKGGSRRPSPEEGAEVKVYLQSEPRRGRANAEELASTPMGDGEKVRASNSRPWTTSKLGNRSELAVSNGNKSVATGAGSRSGQESRKSNGASNSGGGGGWGIPIGTGCAGAGGQCGCRHGRDGVRALISISCAGAADLGRWEHRRRVEGHEGGGDWEWWVEPEGRRCSVAERAVAAITAKAEPERGEGATFDPSA
ncbi:hypothetical protein KC19_VG214100 [Ceratodon purpureus]|uniref:RING-type domain-containing protein n=1 Tax=Ceratodon purpureus TaxID=3225 RepID=A0A8T0HSB0_CERPU|nr:hypothetical protein KC19_VG214100 [Ceratodon purpureus]